jgi:hypothetical protein
MIWATGYETMRLRGLWVRFHTLMLLVLSGMMIEVGNKQDFTDSDDVRRKGTIKLALLQAPLDSIIL